MNSVTKTIGQAFLQIGNRLRYGPGAAEGDFTSLMLPRETDPRSQRGAIIKELASNRMHVRWMYVCERCGTNNLIAIIHSDRKVTCNGGCGKEFSIATLKADAIRRARLEANKTRGANIKLDAPITAAEEDAWYFSLPEHIPSLVADPRKSISEQLEACQVTNETAAVEWTGSKYTESLDSALGFANPGSGSWR